MLGSTTVFVLLMSVLIENISDFWKIIIGVPAMFIFIGLARLIPHIPTKDKRLDNLEEKVFNLLIKENK